MYIEKLASQIKNDVVSGLRGYHSNLSMNMEQLQDEIISCRLDIIRLLYLKGNLSILDLLMAINCIDVDCKSLERCTCQGEGKTPTAHFQIPQIITFLSEHAINYLGSIDRKNKFRVVTSLALLKSSHYRKRGLNKPIVWIDVAPNSEGMLDCYIFNAPFLRQVSIVAAFKDPRLLAFYSCCQDEDNLMGADINISYIDKLVKDKLTKEKLYYYRQVAPPKLPNDLQYVTGG